MNEWGLPDWRNEQSYGAAQTWSLLRWRWEFYRRRDDLRAAFDLWAERRYAERVAEVEKVDPDGPNLAPHEPGFTTMPYGGDPFGYYGLPNPRISAQPEATLRFITVSDAEAGWYEAEHYECAPLEEPYQIAVTFDIGKPLAEQIEWAKQRLLRTQRARFGKKLSKKHRRPALWLTYLRALDARECGASYSEIRAALLPGHKEEPQAARDTLLQADALREKF